jgi:hypothetical protein
MAEVGNIWVAAGTCGKNRAFLGGCFNEGRRVLTLIGASPLARAGWGPEFCKKKLSIFQN